MTKHFKVNVSEATKLLAPIAQVKSPQDHELPKDCTNTADSPGIDIHSSGSHSHGFAPIVSYSSLTRRRPPDTQSARCQSCLPLTLSWSQSCLLFQVSSGSQTATLPSRCSRCGARRAAVRSPGPRPWHGFCSSGRRASPARPPSPLSARATALRRGGVVGGKGQFRPELGQFYQPANFASVDKRASGTTSETF